MEAIENMSAFSEFINSPALTIICAFLLVLVGAVGAWIFLVTGKREQDVAQAKAETQRVVKEARKYFRDLERRIKELGVEKFVMSMEIKELQRENDRLNYRINQLTKGADFLAEREERE